MINKIIRKTFVLNICFVINLADSFKIYTYTIEYIKKEDIMSEHVQQVKEVNNNGVASRTTRVTDDETVNGPALASRVVWYIAGVIIVLLALRFVLILLGANQANSFVNFIYSLSYPFAVPFFGIFGYSLKYGVSKVEVSTLVAMGVYALIAYGIARLLTINRASEN